MPSRRINEPNRNAGIRTGYTVLGGSHNAENQTTEQDKKQKQKKTTGQTTNKTHKTQNRHCEQGQLSRRKVMAYASPQSHQYGVK